MDGSELKELLAKYRAGTSTAEERALLENWVAAVTYPEYEISEKELLEDLSAVRNSLPLVKQHRTVRLWPRVAVVAAAVAAVVFGVWFLNSRYDMNAEPGNVVYVNDVAPGKNGATITLGNGKVVELSASKSGVVVGDRVSYSDGSIVRYSSGSRSSGSLKGSQNSTGPVGVRSLTLSELQGADGKAQILTARTAKGQTYQFTLPDGTKVWLNADSKLEFPSSFVGGRTRFVKLSGEGYFEVAKDKAHPFIVSTSDQNVEVLGTHFNLNTFGDEHPGTVTSLLEGSVKVTGRDGARVLKPGDRGVYTMKGPLLLPGDANDDIDWKNGDFVFNRESLSEIMRKVSRWYDIEVIYDGDVDQQQTFGGKVSRKRNISQVIKALQATQALKFRIEGRKVYVTN